MKIENCNDQYRVLEMQPRERLNEKNRSLGFRLLAQFWLSSVQYNSMVLVLVHILYMSVYFILCIKLINQFCLFLSSFACISNNNSMMT